MSTDWGYRCETCQDDSYEWFNHGDRDLIEIYQQWPKLRDALVAFQGANWRLGIEIRGEGLQVLAFLQQHDGHVIVLHNEYGDTRPIPLEEPCQS